MSASVLIGVDAGTSVIKAVAFDLSGQQVAIASRRNSYTTLPNGGVEQDMARTWQDAVAVIAEVVAEVGAANVEALAVTGQGDGTWLIDENGAPVHDGWLWLDARSGKEAREIANGPGIDTIYRGTGTGINLCQMRTHLRWMEANAPDLLKRAATAFHCKDWLYFNLTGIRATDPAEALFTFGDIHTRDYSEAVIEALGLTAYRALMPPILDGATQTHALSTEAAKITSLPVGCPVCLGYLDVVCTALGAGLHDPQALPGFSVLGSTGVHMRYVPDAASVTLSDDHSGYTMAFPGPAYAQMHTNMAATLNIDWLMGLGAELLAAHGVTKSTGEMLDGLDARVMAARPGAALYHPYISAAGERGPFAEPAARASFTGMDQATGWFDMVRGVYDGLALASRDCYTAMGAIPDEIRISGGASRSEALNVILASALNRPVRKVAQDEAGAAGAVMIAGIAMGHFADATAATEAWVQPLLQDPLPPDPSLTGTYDTLFDAYLATRHAMPAAWEAQASMRETLS